ncbi:glycosyltransferase family 9 protein [Hymenobacter sp. BT683]|uniref:Glycosyltransferase family 9 protein n=1 Tax=Hymenobacter jeongseonensis TaxID=2791027 RepID=A0ABS0IKB5_9BACT|nr:glycosyltransferase family 9 protein [Hymenobacter jeongseonensis]MBF9238791.1 glycosyltransferase family 9 protein [Hymenobacter jeongseonensis]
MSQTFLISRTDAIGDVVLTLPVAGQLKRMFPNCRVVFIGRTYTAPIAAACPWVDDFLNLDDLLKQPEAAQVATLQAFAASAIVHVFPNKTLARLAKKAKIPVRIGTRNRWQHWLTCNRLVALSRRHSSLHEAQLNLQLLQPLGFAAVPALVEVAKLVRLHSLESLSAPLQALLRDRRPGRLNVILHPRSRGSAREWGLDNFGQLARLLHQAGHRVFVTGTAAEGEELADWLQQNAAFLAADLTGKLGLPQFLAFIAATDGLVAGSTGPLHLAAALGRHALGLYPLIRPMHPGRWGPLGEHADYMVFEEPNCEACRTQPAACRCIRAIEPVAVAARVLAWPPLF